MTQWRHSLAGDNISDRNNLILWEGEKYFYDLFVQNTEIFLSWDLHKKSELEMMEIMSWLESQQYLFQPVVRLSNSGANNNSPLLACYLLREIKKMIYWLGMSYQLDANPAISAPLGLTWEKCCYQSADSVLAVRLILSSKTVLSLSDISLLSSLSTVGYDDLHTILCSLRMNWGLEELPWFSTIDLKFIIRVFCFVFKIVFLFYDFFYYFLFYKIFNFQVPDGGWGGAGGVAPPDPQHLGGGRRPVPVPGGTDN